MLHAEVPELLPFQIISVNLLRGFCDVILVKLKWFDIDVDDFQDLGPGICRVAQDKILSLPASRSSDIGDRMLQLYNLVQVSCAGLVILL